MSWRRLQEMSSRRLQRNNFSSSKMSSRRIWKTSSRRLGRRKIVTLKTFWRRLQDMSSRPVLLISCTSCFHWMFLQLFRIQFFRHRLSRFYYCSCLSEITFSLWLLRLSRKIHFCFCCFDCYYYLKISKQLLPLMSWMNDLKITAQTAHWQYPSGT